MGMTACGGETTRPPTCHGRGPTPPTGPAHGIDRRFQRVSTKCRGHSPCVRGRERVGRRWGRPFGSTAPGGYGVGIRQRGRTRRSVVGKTIPFSWSSSFVVVVVVVCPRMQCWCGEGRTPWVGCSKGFPSRKRCGGVGERPERRRRRRRRIIIIIFFFIVGMMGMRPWWRWLGGITTRQIGRRMLFVRRRLWIQRRTAARRREASCYGGPSLLLWRVPIRPGRWSHPFPIRRTTTGHTVMGYADSFPTRHRVYVMPATGLWWWS